MRPAVAAVGRGTGIALAVGFPAALLAQVLDAAGRGPAWIAYPLALVVLVGTALGGRATARRAGRRPVALAATTGLIAIIVVQTLGALRRNAAGHDIAWSTTPLVTALAVGLAATAAARTTTRAGRTRP